MASPEDLIAPRPPRYFEARRKIFPKAVRGSYRNLKWAIMAVTLAIYYVTPWLRWDRGPYAPDQAVLVDIANRRFFMFAIEIWPHEFYYVAGLLIMAAIGLFLVTSSVGRAWCGYACPQTVWTDLFLHVERAIDGDRNAQIRLQKARLGPSKIAKRVTKHGIWLVISVLTGGAWVFYFADAPTLAREIVTGQGPYVAYATIALLTATTYVLGGLMREQFCIYACPWPRIQGAMLDEKSLLVTYKYWRGEPRTHGLKRAAPERVLSLVALAANPELAPRIGDCIDCNACVAVCPTGIDIREGSQIGCITCGLCIDACDEVMDRLDRPRRLIGYSTIADEQAAGDGKAPEHPMKRLLRPRAIAYFLIWASIGLAMLFALGTRSRLDLSVSQNRNPVYVRLSDGSIRNNFTLKVRNMQSRPREVEISIEGLPGGALWSETAARQGAERSIRLNVPADKVTKLRLFVAAPSDGPSRSDLTFRVRALDAEGGEDTHQIHFERPETGR
ncbi:cytochrome c oxidase accessory protein CcoG [Sphingomonas sp. HF-S4]|uniref:Cytochrome c oxidase accessory protein CcoG n=1 Tax=Sphingomonas agrestis TaxID=3080540 RepID=A0ABU3Y3T8_9SPHN|nr:cytochrome c oxidase accessory protein CcoG [Sphingomonas sp. HF-S4]MDV3456013.1 cytochrome c oxidase accessory protein CcoG [Sphingomonas sp. HF-S4]